MEEQKVTTPLVKGSIIGLILIVLSTAGQFMGLARDNAIIQVLSILILVGGIIWSCWFFGKQKDNYVTFGQLFGHGFKTTAVIGLIVIVFSVIFFLAFPQYMDEAMDQARVKMEERGDMSDSQIDEAMSMSKRLFIPIMIVSILFIYAIIGAIASLIGAAITKKNPVNPLDQTRN